MDPIQPTPSIASMVKSSSPSPRVRRKLLTNPNAPPTDPSPAEPSPQSQPNPYTLEKQSPPPISLHKQVKESSPMQPVTIEDEGPFSLSTFVSQYAHLLPLRITVEKGHDGEDERHSIAMGDVYDIHFVKSSKIALLQDASGMTHIIPLNSAVQFGPIFDPNHNPKEALCGLTFEKVSDVIAQKLLPKVVRATKAHISSKSKSSVEENEMLVVQKTVHTTMRKKALQVYSITTGEQKLLEGTCLGGFTTDPYAVRLHLPEIIEHFSDKFPLQVQVIMDESSAPGDLPCHVTSEVSTLTELQTETSLIASTYWGEKDNIPEEHMIPFDIPVDLPIDVSIVKQEDKKGIDLEALYIRTKNVFERFDPSKTLSIRVSSSELHTAVRKGFEKEGIKLHRPDRVYERVTISRPQQPPVLTKYQVPSAGSKKNELSSPLPPSPKPKPRNVQRDSPQIKQKHISAQENLVSVSEERPDDRQTLVSPKVHYEAPNPATSTAGSAATINDANVTLSSATECSSQAGQLIARVETLEKELRELKSEVANLRSQVARGHESPVYVTRVPPKTASELENLKTLQTFSIEKVVELLQAMSMSQYGTTFIDNEIGGDILAECDEDVLEKELGVSQKIHRIKLLQVMAGKKSATALLAEKKTSAD